MICHKSADVWKISNGKSSILVTFILRCPYKSRTKFFNPTKEKPVHSLEHTSWIWASQMKRRKMKPSQGGLSASGAELGVVKVGLLQ